MKNTRAMKTQLVMAIVTAWIFSTAAQAQPTIYFVRHAEKLANWPGGRMNHFQPLSKKGIARAKRLAKRFKKGSLTAIYSSTTTRTLHTAFPVSQKLDVPIQITQACMDTSAIDSFLENLNQQYDTDDTILLVSHSNIIPYLLIKAGLPDRCRKKMGIHETNPDEWLLIKGYEDLWKFARSEKSKTCAGFQKMKF